MRANAYVVGCAIIALAGTGAGVLLGQSDPVSPRISALQKQLQAGERAALEAFWQNAAKQGTPLVEPIPGDDRNVLATFLWRATDSPKSVIVWAPLAGGINNRHAMQALAGTDLWYKTFKLRHDLRFNYFFAVDPPPPPGRAEFRKDPLSPRTSPDFFGNKTSLVELPAATAQPWVEPRAGVPQGRVEEHRIKSAILGNERNIWVYTPAGYSQTARPCALLVLFDGKQYLGPMAAPVTLDNLIAKGLLPPMAAVMIDNVNRSRELSNYEPFVEFLAKELIPWVRHRYRVTSDPRQTIVAGASAGGLTAAFVNPVVIGKSASPKPGIGGLKLNRRAGDERARGIGHGAVDCGAVLCGQCEREQ
jgi:hypothetical protein